MAHLPVPVAWLGVVGRRWKQARKRRQNTVVPGVEEDGERRPLQGLQASETTSAERGRGLGEVAQAWEGLELPRKLEGIAGELELGDGGPRPARPGYGFLLDRGVCVSAGGCSRRLGRGSIYRRATRVLRAPPVDTCPRRPATSGVSERGRRRRRSRGHYGRAETSTGSRG